MSQLYFGQLLVKATSAGYILTFAGFDDSLSIKNKGSRWFINDKTYQMVDLTFDLDQVLLKATLKSLNVEPNLLSMLRATKDLDSLFAQAVPFKDVALEQLLAVGLLVPVKSTVAASSAENF